MSTRAEQNAIKLWGEEAAKQFLRLPSEFLYHYRDLGLTHDDFMLIITIDYYQWSEKPAFPHPSRLAYILDRNYKDVVAHMKDLAGRGYLIIEPTKSNPSNYHQDLRPTRNMLRKYLRENPNHCSWQKEKDPKRRIDTSTNRKGFENNRSTLKDASIPTKKNDKSPESVGDILNKKDSV